MTAADQAAKTVYDREYAAYIAAGADEDDAREAAEWASAMTYDPSLDADR